MKSRLLPWFILTIMLLGVVACQQDTPSLTEVATITQSATSTEVPTEIEEAMTATATQANPEPTDTPDQYVILTDDEIATLSSLVQVDEYPLYVMHYYGNYLEYSLAPRPMAGKVNVETWGCSLFTALGDQENQVFGRNFDSQYYSPTLLLFTDPPDGYASASMQSVRFMGNYGADASDLTANTLEELYMLLYTPIRPYDGMNEAGLAIGMAAVPIDGTRHDPAREDIDMLTVMRQVLDHAANVDEAVEIIGQYNVVMASGLPVHYLIADASGQSVLVEFYEGEMVVIPNEDAWQAATNFFLTSAGNHPEDQCWRYERMTTSLTNASGQCSVAEAMSILEDVFQESTQWSAVYNLSTREIDIVVGGKYATVHTFQLGE
jgi:hypothetical protein